jgi:TetR/AcrR family tetracycline transcriptional repressor
MASSFLVSGGNQAVICGSGSEAGRAMTSTTAGRRSRRRRRGSLTPEAIVAESLRLLDTEGADGFSLPKLGRALGADPTAVYRHFASKDDLVLAIADRLIEEAMTGLVPQECWVDTVTDVARRLRATYRAHPAAAALSASRTTQRPSEMRVVDALIGAVLAAGFTGAAAARMYRALGDFSLAWAGSEAAFFALDPSQQEADTSAWTRAYLAVDRVEYPQIWQIRDELAGVTGDDIFETILGLVIGGLIVKARRPCGCGKHDAGASTAGTAP